MATNWTQQKIFMISFSVKDIKNEFDPGSYARGISYYNQGRVTKLKLLKQAADYLDLYGEVTGSFRYAQEITVYKNAFDVDVEGECSCPVGFNCKHVVAVLLEYIAFSRQHSTQYQESKSLKLIAKQPHYASPGSHAIERYLHIHLRSCYS